MCFGDLRMSEWEELISEMLIPTVEGPPIFIITTPENYMSESTSRVLRCAHLLDYKHVT